MLPPPCTHCGNPVPIYRVDAFGRPILDVDGRAVLKSGPTPKYCSDRCKKRAQRAMPNVPNTRKPRKRPIMRNHTDLDAPKPKKPRFRAGWVPLHPVDDPVRGHCGACGAPLYRRDQEYCGPTPCPERGYTEWHPKVRPPENIREAAWDRARAIDACQFCDDDGRLRNGNVCKH